MAWHTLKQLTLKVLSAFWDFGRSGLVVHRDHATLTCCWVAPAKLRYPELLVLVVNIAGQYDSRTAQLKKSLCIVHIYYKQRIAPNEAKSKPQLTTQLTRLFWLSGKHQKGTIQVEHQITWHNKVRASTYCTSNSSNLVVNRLFRCCEQVSSNSCLTFILVTFQCD